MASGTSSFVSARSGSGDEIHVVVIDEDGSVSGVPGSVLETYSKLSKNSDAKSHKEMLTTINGNSE